MLGETQRPHTATNETPRRDEILLNTSHAMVAPGQGSQEVGMGMELAQRSPAAAQVWDEANRALYPSLGSRFTDLVWHGTQAELTLTQNAQPAIIAVSLARLAALKETGQYDNPAFHAGNSLGFITALVTAGSLSIPGAVQLSQARGEAFRQAINPNDKTTMIVLSKVNHGIMADMMKKFSLDKTLVNTDTQIVLGGRVADVAQAIEFYSSLGEEAKQQGRVVPIDVDAAFHSRHMEPAVPIYAKALEGIEITAPTNGKLIGGSTVRELLTPEDIRAELIAQLTHTERWNEVVKLMRQRGVTTMTELGEQPRLLLMVREIEGGGPRPYKITTPTTSPEDKGVVIAQQWKAAA